jgi:hypothetical protein
MRAVVFVVLAGCAELWVPAPASNPDARFPHPPDYERGAVHGADALPLDEAGCMACHRDSSDTAPACTSCHDSFPHPVGWRAGARHGTPLLGPTGADLRPCEECHLQPGMQATDEVPCTLCHASFPHPDDWALGGIHGTHAIGSGDPRALCGTCHGADLGGGNVGVACDLCHTAYPHPTGWADPSGHGASALADLSSCLGCHGEGGTGGPAEVPCTRCHPTFPHAANWPAAHLTAADRVGEAVCLGCHEPGDGPATMVALCGARCHGGAE